MIRNSVIRVGIDRQTFAIQKYGGISRYFSDLFLGLKSRNDVEVELLFSRHQNEYLLSQGIGRNIGSFQRKLYTKAMTMGKWNIPISKKVQIQHSTYYLGAPKKIPGSGLLVATLHDMIPELHPHYFKLNPHANKTAWLSASDLIISISKTTASDFAYYHPKLASKIKCIHLYSGFSHGARQSKPKEGNPSSLFFLYVGQRGTYKNCSLLLRAFAASQPQKHGYLLLCAGGGAFSKKELEDIARLNITGYVSQLSVTDANLWYLYCKASAVLVPSLSEGFSLPLVEGLSADVPVVCSDIPVHREVAKDYAQLINPTQHDDWADVLRSAEQLTKPSVALGKQQYQERLKYFSRERMVEEHVEAYKSLVG